MSQYTQLQQKIIVRGICTELLGDKYPTFEDVDQRFSEFGMTLISKEKLDEEADISYQSQADAMATHQIALILNSILEDAISLLEGVRAGMGANDSLIQSVIDRHSVESAPLFRNELEQSAHETNIGM